MSKFRFKVEVDRALRRASLKGKRDGKEDLPNPYTTTFKSGDTVHWQFVAKPGTEEFLDDYRPMVACILPAPPEIPNRKVPIDQSVSTGVFKSLEPRGSSTVFGEVAFESIGSHSYWFWLVPRVETQSLIRLFCDDPERIGGKPQENPPPD